MNQLKIAFGTNSESKRTYIEEVIKTIGIDAVLLPKEVESGAPDQPTTEYQTRRGSLNRAKNALSTNKEADCSLGVEIGYHKNKKGRYEMFCCATIIDSKNYVATCTSSKLPLPDFHHEIIENERDLRSKVHEYKKGDKNPHVNFVRTMIIDRKPFIVEATRNSLLLYLNRSSYQKVDYSKKE